MEKARAKRKLKKSYTQKRETITVDDYVKEECNGIYLKQKKSTQTIFAIKQKIKEIILKIKSKGIKEQKPARSTQRRHKSDLEEKSFFERFLEKQKIRIVYQTIVAVCVSLFVLLVNVFDIAYIKESQISKTIVAEFRKHSETQEIYAGSKEIMKSLAKIIMPIIPDEVSQKTIQVFNNIVNKDKNIEIYKENEIGIYDEKTSGRGSVEAEKVDISDAITMPQSSTSVEEIVLNNIKNSKVSFIAPTYGYITSKFGAREAIFDGVDPYHYGVDVGNVIGTPIYASMSGTVTKAEYNEQAGNYIEIQQGDVATRYCHLDKINVKINNVVKQGQQIGTMGTTGYSTGPHLHFEIMFNRVRIDPLLIVKINQTR